MGWIILGHTYLNALKEPLQNPTFVDELFSRSSFSIVVAAPFAVDVFFYMTGFLTTYLLSSDVHHRDGRVPNILFLYIHRIFRLVPLYALTLLAFVWIFPLYGDGPIFFQYRTKVDTCERLWWTNLLFINNFYDEWCMGWTWYLPNDMQFFLAAPILVWIFFKRRAVAYTLLILLLLGSFAGTLYITNYYSLMVSYRNVKPNYYESYYNVPWCRCGPFILGMFFGFGYFSFKYIDREASKMTRVSLLIRDKRILRWTGYLLGLGIINTCIFLQYPLNNHPQDTTSL